MTDDQTKLAAARDAIARFMWAMQPNRDPMDTWDDTMAPAWHPEADALLALPDVKALIGCVPAPEKLCEARHPEHGTPCIELAGHEPARLHDDGLESWISIGRPTP